MRRISDGIFFAFLKSCFGHSGNNTFRFRLFQYMIKPEILTIENLCKFEHLVNRNDAACDINMMIMPGTLEDKHKNIDPAKGIPAVRRQFSLIFLFLGGEQDLYLGADYLQLKPNDLVIVPVNMVAASPIISNCT